MNTDTNETYYTHKLKSVDSDNNGNFLAKDLAHAMAYKTAKNFYIRVDDVGNLHNPYGQQTIGTSTKYRLMDDQHTHFRKVNEEIFQLYLKFLRTNNKVYLSQAERDSL